MSRVILLGKIWLQCDLNLLLRLSLLQSLSRHLLLLGGSAREGDSSSTEGSGTGSDSGSGLELSHENEPFLESPTRPKVPSERSPGLPSQEDLSVDQSQFLWGQGLIYP